MKLSILFGLGTALLSLGLAVGGYMAGVDSVRNAPSSTGSVPLPVFASASSESDGVALATGAYGSNSEALFYLDSQSGRLSGALLARDAPTFQKTFSRNVKNDLVEAASQLKIAVPTSPKFLMVTGEADVRSVGPLSNLSKTFAYVAEINSGVVLVYALPGTNDRDLAVSSGEIVLWTFARLNDGLQSAAAFEPQRAVQPEVDAPQAAPSADLIDAGFYRNR